MGNKDARTWAKTSISSRNSGHGAIVRFSRILSTEFRSRIPRGFQGMEQGCKRGFAHTFFYRANLSWNRLPLTLQEIIRPSVFKSMLIKYIWEELTTTVLDSDDEHGWVVGIFSTCT